MDILLLFALFCVFMLTVGVACVFVGIGLGMLVIKWLGCDHKDIYFDDRSRNVNRNIANLRVVNGNSKEPRSRGCIISGG